jgi:hypothetical protein
MTCPTCKWWRATTEEQLRERQRKLALDETIGVAACPACGGTDWVISRAAIGAERPSRWWWQFFPRRPA